MSLVTWKYQRRRRQGAGTKALEQSGDWPRLMEHLIKLSEAHQDFETAAELRAQLNPQPATTMEPEPEPEKPVRIRKRKPKSPPPSSSDKKLKEAWREIDRIRGRGE
jgi:hypothetical protein